MVPVFAIIACQRSGTHLFRQILNTHPQIAVAMEPFFAYDSPANWHSYLRSLPCEKVLATTSAATTDLLEGFATYLHQHVQACPEKYGGSKQAPSLVGYDIKYNQIKIPSPAYRDLRARPFLLDYIQNRPIRVIHLVRSNVIHVAISRVISDIRQVWHNCDGIELPGAYYINPKTLFGYAQWAHGERLEFERLSQGMDIQRFEYEEVSAIVCDSGATNKEHAGAKTLNRISEFLEVPNQFRTKGHMQKVVNRPYSEVIENYDEVVAAVKDSSFSQFADSI